MNRRQFLPAPVVLALAACGSTAQQPTVPLEQAKAYAIDLVDALSAGAQNYLAHADPTQQTLIISLMAAMQEAKTALAATEVVLDARSFAVQILGFAQQLSPFLSVFLGPAAPFVPAALSVLQAFIALLPAPPNTPPQPPAQLRALAAKYRASK